VEARPQSRYYADVAARTVALFLDAILLTIAIFVAAVAVSVAIGPAVELNSAADTVGDAVTLHRGVAIVDAFVSLAVSAAYFGGSWIVLGASPAQRLMGMHVGAQADGATLSREQALVRWALLAAPFGISALLTTAFAGPIDTIAPTLTIAWYVILLVTTAVSATKQGIHDRIPGTVVAKRGRPVAWDESGADAR
jgi:uncharacterized RDD family membrane protein YckC